LAESSFAGILPRNHPQISPFPRELNAANGIYAAWRSRRSILPSFFRHTLWPPIGKGVQPVSQNVPIEEIERAIENFQAKVAAVVSYASDEEQGRREAAKRVLAEAFALGRLEGVGLDTMKQMLVDEYGKELTKPEERAGRLVFALFAWAASARLSLGKVGRWQAAEIFRSASSP
jgi:hypothetical protein